METNEKKVQNAGTEPDKQDDAVLSFDDTEISYDGETAVKHITLSVRAGEILAILGEAGSGKSTVLRSVLGLLGPHGAVTGGDIRFEGRSILSLSRGELHELRGEEMEIISQHEGGSFDAVESVEERLYESVRKHRSWTMEEVRKKALDYLDKMGIPDAESLLRKYPFELTPGMRQRINIMMAMILDPGLLLVDDVTSELDSAARIKVLELLRKIRTLYHTAIVIVTHRVDVAKTADYVAVMKGGRIDAYGTPEQVLSHPSDEYTKKLVAEAEAER